MFTLKRFYGLLSALCIGLFSLAGCSAGNDSSSASVDASRVDLEDNPISADDVQLLNDSIGRHVITAKLENHSDSPRNVTLQLNAMRKANGNKSAEEKISISKFNGVSDLYGFFSSDNSAPLYIDAKSSVNVAIYPLCHTSDSSEFLCDTENEYNTKDTYTSVYIDSIKSKVVSVTDKVPCSSSLDFSLKTTDSATDMYATIVNKGGKKILDMKLWLYVLDDDGNIVPQGAIYGWQGFTTEEAMRPFGMHVKEFSFSHLKPGDEAEMELKGAGTWKVAGASCALQAEQPTQ